MKKNTSLIAIILAISGCASGSSILVGEARQPIEPNKVHLYVEQPANYKTIALVSASSDAGLTEQDSVNYAVEELKKQAAKLGANGVLLKATSNNNSVMLGGQGTSSQYLFQISEQTVSGHAIYIEK